MAGPRAVGINRTTDASICVVEGEHIACALQKERITRQKHDTGALGDLSDLYRPRLASLERPVDVVVECFSSDREAAHVDRYEQELRDCLTFRDRPRVVRLSHHLAHVYGAFLPSPFAEAAVLVADYQGSAARDLDPADLAPRASPDESPSPDALEVISHFVCRGREVRCLDRQLWHKGRQPVAGLGAFYTSVTHMLLAGGVGREGIVMGLASLGDHQALGLPRLQVREGRVTVPDRWLALIAEPAAYRFLVDGSGSFRRCADLAAAAQWAFEEALVEIAQWLRERSRSDCLVYTGGCALNCAANQQLLQRAGFRQVFIPPAPHDGGTALGCALYGLVEELGSGSWPRWQHDFLGPSHDVEAFVQSLDGHDKVRLQRPVDLPAQVAEALAGGRIVALFQGRSESGPRALGHRSILADPRYAFMTSYINEHVKGRQWFRPLAPMVTEEEAAEWFEVDRPSPFMQYAAGVTAAARKRVPAVCHLDGTARLQTVQAQHEPFAHHLLRAFRRITGVGVLINTSFNGPYEPIVETPEDALRCFLEHPIHLLVMPPWVICKTAAVPHPYRR